jgi:spore coat polysaccharide biosynthesis protein SpsF
MRVGAVVLARLSSTRLPGKVLADVGGRTLIGHVIARLGAVPGLDGIVVATSDQPGDDPIEEWGRANAVDVFRGDLLDVRGRVLACAERHGFDACARVNADSPWIDAELLERAIAAIRTGGHDLVTNVQERSFPYGVSAEVMTVDALRRSIGLGADPQDAEHVTRTFYRNPESFSIANLRSDTPYDPDTRLTIDTPEDLHLFEQVVARLGDEAVRVDTKALLATVAEIKAAPTT